MNIPAHFTPMHRSLKAHSASLLVFPDAQPVEVSVIVNFAKEVQLQSLPCAARLDLPSIKLNFIYQLAV